MEKAGDEQARRADAETRVERAARMGAFDRRLDALKSELSAIRDGSRGVRQDVQDLHQALAGHSARLEGIERQLNDTETA